MRSSEAGSPGMGGRDFREREPRRGCCGFSLVKVSITGAELARGLWVVCLGMRMGTLPNCRTGGVAVLDDEDIPAVLSVGVGFGFDEMACRLRNSSFVNISDTQGEHR